MLASRGFRVMLLGMVIPAAVWGQAGSMGARVPKSIPFTMSQTETRVQTLPDGSTVTHVTIIRTLRDSQGRTRTERISDGGTEYVRRDGNKTYLRHRPDFVVVTIIDPIAGITMNWTDNAAGQTKLVSLTHNHQTSRIPPVGAPRQPIAATQPEGPEAVMEQEDLGIKSLKGVYVRGTRTSTAFPAGFSGNTAAYTTSNEYWRSEDLNGLMVEQMNNSLGTKSTTTLDSYTPGEPDPSVFQAPIGYTIWDREASGEAR